MQFKCKDTNRFKITRWKKLIVIIYRSKESLMTTNTMEMTKKANTSLKPALRKCHPQKSLKDSTPDNKVNIPIYKEHLSL